MKISNPSALWSENITLNNSQLAGIYRLLVWWPLMGVNVCVHTHTHSHRSWESPTTKMKHDSMRLGHTNERSESLSFQAANQPINLAHLTSSEGRILSSHMHTQCLGDKTIWTLHLLWMSDDSCKYVCGEAVHIHSLMTTWSGVSWGVEWQPSFTETYQFWYAGIVFSYCLWVVTSYWMKVVWILAGMNCAGNLEAEIF